MIAVRGIVIVADNQDMTFLGLSALLQSIGCSCRRVAKKVELIEQLEASPEALVVVDYTLFDLHGIEELMILAARFPLAGWLLFSDDLSEHFLRQAYFSDYLFGAVLKACSQDEITGAIERLLAKQEYVCHELQGVVAARPSRQTQEKAVLTATELEILRLIAVGRSTKEIAAERFLSTHTVVTHRKNIFRKLEVNNVHEATRYAIRAGIVDMAEYYI